MTKLGFDMAGFAIIAPVAPDSPPVVFDYNTLPPEWEQIRTWERNPSFRYTLESSAPYHAIPSDLSKVLPEDRPYWDACRSIGIKAGFVVHEKRPSNAICVVSGMRDCGKVTEAETKEVLPKLMYLQKTVGAILVPLLLPDAPLREKVRLTKRQLDVLRFAASGWSSEDISKVMHISVDTVKHHRKNIISLLNANNIQHAIALVVKAGIITPLDL